MLVLEYGGLLRFSNFDTRVTSIYDESGEKSGV